MSIILLILGNKYQDNANLLEINFLDIILATFILKASKQRSHGLFLRDMFGNHYIPIASANFFYLIYLTEFLYQIIIYNSQ